MKDWERVLWNWRRRGRTGLTIHALAAICGRDPRRLLRELRPNPRITAFYCYTVEAPVFAYCLDINTVAGARAYRQWGIWKKAESCLVAWPWPKYKGVVRGKGVTTLGISRPKSLLKEPQ